MKAKIHILPTDKPSRLYYNGTSYKDPNSTMAMDWFISSAGYKPQNIYITSDEEIKEGDYWIYICPINGLDYGDNNNPIVKNNLPNSWFEKLHDKKNYKKIILTTDQDLIKDGVQAIDDEFLEWFVKNPSCEEVEVGYGWIRLTETDNEGYWVSIPDKQFEMQQEEPKQETLEEAAKSYIENTMRFSFISLETKTQANRMLKCAEFGAKWQAERMYSKEEVKSAFKIGFNIGYGSPVSELDLKNEHCEKWFEQFKNK